MPDPRGELRVILVGEGPAARAHLVRNGPDRVAISTYALPLHDHALPSVEAFDREAKPPWRFAIALRRARPGGVVYVELSPIPREQYPLMKEESPPEITVVPIDTARGEIDEKTWRAIHDVLYAAAAIRWERWGRWFATMSAHGGASPPTVSGHRDAGDVPENEDSGN